MRDERLDFAFETTLGGHTIATLLHKAWGAGVEIRIWFVGLSSLDLHIARVRSRVARGGHDIPAEKIRERYDQKRINLIGFMSKTTELRVYDNSLDADPYAGVASATSADPSLDQTEDRPAHRSTCSALRRRDAQRRAEKAPEAYLIHRGW